MKDALTHGGDANTRAAREPIFGWTRFVAIFRGEYKVPVLWSAAERYLQNKMMGPPQPERMQADAEIFEALLDAHADPNIRIDPDRRLDTDNLLYYAINGKVTPICLSLLKQGAALPNKINGQPPLQAAVSFDNAPEVVQALIRAGVDAKGEAGKQALLSAYQQIWGFPARHKDALAIFQVLLDAGVDPNSPYPNALSGGSLLYDAVQWKHSEVVPMLLRAHADPRSIPEHDTPLLYCAIEGRPDIFQELLESGADANTHDSNGEPLLWYAVIHRIQEPEADKVLKVKLLPRHGADVSATIKTYNYGNLTVPEAAHRNAREGHISKPILDLLDQAVNASTQHAAPPAK